MSMCPNYRILEVGKQPLVMLLHGVYWRSNRNHYLLVLVLVMRAVAMSTHVRTYAPTENQ